VTAGCSLRHIQAAAREAAHGPGVKSDFSAPANKWKIYKTPANHEHLLRN
jgi:hypothetical protein